MADSDDAPPEEEAPPLPEGGIDLSALLGDPQDMPPELMDAVAEIAANAKASEDAPKGKRGRKPKAPSNPFSTGDARIDAITELLCSPEMLPTISDIYGLPVYTAAGFFKLPDELTDAVMARGKPSRLERGGRALQLVIRIYAPLLAKYAPLFMLGFCYIADFLALYRLAKAVEEMNARAAAGGDATERARDTRAGGRPAPRPVGGK